MKLADAAGDFLAGAFREVGRPTAPAPLHRHGPRDGHRIALTFDDGPSAATAAVLDTLERHRARATFFVVGMHIRGSEHLVRRISAEGHEVGNHSWHHRLCGDRFRDLGQLAVTTATIRQSTGVRPRLFRAPDGRYPKRLGRTVSAAGLRAIGWDVDPKDWLRPGHDVIARRVLLTVRGGSIVLFHDGPQIDAAETSAMLDELLPRLTERGYELVTVSELLDGVPGACGDRPGTHEGRS